jgi:hypothetical protein
MHAGEQHRCARNAGVSAGEGCQRERCAHSKAAPCIGETAGPNESVCINFKDEMIGEGIRNEG